MQPRRSLRLVAIALVLALPLLGSCGFDRKTNMIYTPGAGTNNREGQVNVLAAVVASAQAGSGTFIATLSNTSAVEPATFDGLSGAGEWQDLQVDDIDPVELPPHGFVNFADEGGVHISGDFTPGQVLSLTLSFESGDSVSMSVPVVYACDEYDGLDSSGDSGSSASAEASDSPSPGEVPSESSSPSESPSASGSGSAETYDCASVLGE
jgi:hypothetical protein